jgi:hypothetical protein
MAVKQETGQFADILRRSQLAVDIADGNPTKADFFVGSPLAVALVFRGYARAVLGLPGWREDFDEGLAMAREYDPPGYAAAIAWKCGAVLQHGLVVIDDAAIVEMEQALEIAGDFGDSNGLGLMKYVLGCALVLFGFDVERGLRLLSEIREMCGRGQFWKTEIPIIDLIESRETALNGDPGTALPTTREAVDTLFVRGQLGFCSWATCQLVDVLLRRGSADDLREAETAVERLAAAPIDDLVVRDVMLLRLRAMLAQARGDDAAYRGFRDDYRAMAAEYGFEGHVAVAADMP